MLNLRTSLTPLRCCCRSTLYYVTLAGTLAIVLHGCDFIKDNNNYRGKPIERGLGKSDGTGSCEGHCGDQAPAGCWCDDQCEIYKDCCTDKKPVCDQQASSCEGSCGGQSPDGCYCDELCERIGDCCDDKVAVCDQGGGGGKCFSDAECGKDEFCYLEPHACTLQTFYIQSGKCQAKPTACYKIYAPVCGCDGKTYGNDCMAAAAGASIAYEGECKSNGYCGSNADCAKGEFCQFPQGACDPNFVGDVPPNVPSSSDGGVPNKCMNGAPGTKCGGGGSDAGSAGDNNTDIFGGICQPIPTACYEIYAPVCGCDGKTYDNDCYAAAAGVSILSIGKCGGDECSAEECGPMPMYFAAIYCADGTIAEIVCKNIDGQCGWGPDCDTTEVCKDTPTKTYVGHSPEKCAAMKFFCEEGTQYFWDDCGCGCEVVTPPPCDYNDPKIKWIAQDAKQCMAILFQCAEGFTSFTNDCGCGCIEKDNGQFCGGIGGFPCPSGEVCVLDGMYPDAGGTCQKQCKQDTDCSDGFCGYADGAGTVKACKAWSEEGDYCGGFTPINMQTQCRPGLTCQDVEPMMMDEPGICVKEAACNVDQDCQNLPVPMGACTPDWCPSYEYHCVSGQCQLISTN